MTQELKPPPTLMTCRVVEYAFVNDSLPFCGQGRHFIGDKEMGRVPCLALCENAKEKVVYLVYCERDWAVVSSSSHPSLEAGKALAEEFYPGLSTFWVETHTTEAEAANHIEELWGPHRCVFCGKLPLDYKGNIGFIEKNGRAICEPCVMACYDLLRDEDAQSTQP